MLGWSRPEKRTGYLPRSVWHRLADRVGQYQEFLRDGMERHQQFLLQHSFCHPDSGNYCVYGSFWILYNSPDHDPDDLQHHLDRNFGCSFYCAEYDPYHGDNCVDGDFYRDYHGDEHHQHHDHYGVECHLQHHQAFAGCVQVSV